MKRLTTTLIACALCTIATSQSASWSWAKSGAGPLDDRGHAVATDHSGNVYSTGVFAGTTNMVFGTHTLTSLNEPNSHDEPNKDIFLVKYDPAGNIIWAVSGGGKRMERSYAVDTDPAGNVYIGGSSSSTLLTIGTLSVNKQSSEEFFVAKFDGAGNALWIRTGTGSSQNFVRGLAVDNSGNVVVTGFNMSGDFAIGSHTLNGSAGAMFVAKYNTNGDVLWAKSSIQTNDSYFAMGRSVDIDNKEGDIYVAGYYSNKTLAFDSHTITNGKNGIDPTEDIFLVKYNANGNVSWAKSFGGAENERGMSVSVASSADPYYGADVYLGGHFGGAVLVAGTETLTNTNPSFGQQDIFVLKIEAYTGKVLWASSLNGSGRDLLDGVAAVKNAGVVLLGTFASSVVTSGTLSAAKTNSIGGNSVDILVAGFSASGEPVLLKSAGGSSDDEGGGIAVDKASLAVYVNGMFMSNPATFDAHQLFSTGVDVFTARLSSPEFEHLVLLSLPVNSVSAWTMSPNPTSGKLTLKSDKSYDQITIVVYDICGKVLLKEQHDGSNQINLDISHLAPGLYNAAVTADNSPIILKVIRH